MKKNCLTWLVYPDILL